MISNKSVATLFLITLTMKVVASTSTDDIQGPSLSGKSTLQVRKQERTSRVKKTIPMLKNTNSAMEGVLTGSNQIITQHSICRRLSSWMSEPTTEKFKRFIEEGKYWRAGWLAAMMNHDDLLNLSCSIIKTFEQYKEFVVCLKDHKMVPHFYVHGNMTVVRKAIISESRIYDKKVYVHGGDLEIALPLALREGDHDRVIDFLNIRKRMTAGRDERERQKGKKTSFELFVNWFFYHLTPGQDEMALKQFLIICGDKLRDEHPDILDTLCQELVGELRDRFYDSKAMKLLTDLIGQPSLLTPVSFTKGFLGLLPEDNDRVNFIRHGWSETIREGLKKEYCGGGMLLWQTMKGVRPVHFAGNYPDTSDAFAAVLKHFKTKEYFEEQWNTKNSGALFSKIKSLGPIFNLLPSALWSIIAEYAISWTDV